MSDAGSEWAFDRGVAVKPAGEGRWRGEVESKWNIGSAPNGGYLLSIALSALRETLPHPDPLAVSAHYPNRAAPGPVEVRGGPNRAGTRRSTGVSRREQCSTPRGRGS